MVQDELSVNFTAQRFISKIGGSNCGLGENFEEKKKFNDYKYMSIII